MITAREYFFRHVLEDASAPNFARWRAENVIFRTDIEVPETIRVPMPDTERDHVPNRSNSLLLEQYMDDILESAPAPLKERLSKTFVAKLADFEAGARAHQSHGRYDGDLIFFNVGLSDACLQYALALMGMVQLKLDRENPDRRPSPFEVAMRSKFERMWLDKLSNAQKRWNESGVVRFTMDDLLYSSDELLEGRASLLACDTDRFILGHELCHHLLGHTAQESPSFIEREIPPSCMRRLAASSDAHRQEFEADAGAILLSLAAPANDKVRIEREASMIWGSLLAITVIGQFVPDVACASPSHPSVLERYNQCKEILLHRCSNPKSVLSVIEDIEIFQFMLAVTQGCGLGVFLGPSRKRYLKSLRNTTVLHHM